MYAFGCLLFYMLTGDVPFKREGDEAKLWAHLSEPPPKPSEIVADLPPGLDDVIALHIQEFAMRFETLHQLDRPGHVPDAQSGREDL